MIEYWIQRCEQYPDCKVWSDLHHYITLKEARFTIRECRYITSFKWRLVKRTIKDKVIK